MKVALGWAGVVLIGIVGGLLEDILFINVLVPYMPASLDLTGDLFWIFTVPLAQLMSLAVLGTIGWFLLDLRNPARLGVFWLFWSASRATFLTLFNNPPGDIAIYLAWIALWCALIGVAGYLTRKPA